MIDKRAKIFECNAKVLEEIRKYLDYDEKDLLEKDRQESILRAIRGNAISVSIDIEKQMDFLISNLLFNGNKNRIGKPNTTKEDKVRTTGKNPLKFAREEFERNVDKYSKSEIVAILKYTLELIDNKDPYNPKDN